MTPRSFRQPYQPSQNVLLGIAFMLGAVIMFPFSNAGVKYLGADYPVPMVIWVRYAGHMFLIMLLIMPSRGLSIFKSAHIPSQVFRSLLLFTSTGCYFTAIQFIPLTTAASISFTAPFVVVGLSIFVLGEHVGARRWLAVAIGFVGMLIIIRPGMEGFHAAGFLVFASASCYALYQVITRRLAGQDDNTVTVTYTALVGAVVSSLALPFFWRTPADLFDLMIFLSLGAIGGLAHYWVVKAFQYAEASAVTPLTYLQLVFATILGYVFFNEFPDGWTFVGAAIIVAAGAYIAYRER